MKITDIIPVGARNAISRTDLAIKLNISDRDMRDSIHKASRDTIICNVGQGYFIPDLNDPIDRLALRAFVKQEESRLKSIGWRLKQARKAVRKLEQQNP